MWIWMTIGLTGGAMVVEFTDKKSRKKKKTSTHHGHHDPDDEL